MVSKGAAVSGSVETLRAIAEDRELLKVAHRRIEDALIDFRDNRISLPDRGNGLVVREADGEPSSTIRMTVPGALRMALKAIADELERAINEDSHRRAGHDPLA